MYVYINSTMRGANAAGGGRRGGERAGEKERVLLLYDDVAFQRAKPNAHTLLAADLRKRKNEKMKRKNTNNLADVF